MYCPNCDSDYRPGIVQCADCGSPLVERATVRSADDPGPLELEVVFADSRQDRVAVAKSVLMSMGIEFVVRGEGVQDLFGWGRFPSGTNVFIGPIQILVPRDHAVDARALLEGGAAPSHDSGYEGAASAREDCVPEGFIWRRARSAGRLAAALILAYVVFSLALAIWSQLSML